MTDTVESILESFPNQHIARVPGEPTYKSIKQIEKLLVENAASMHSNLGGGNFGYLGLVIKPARYETISGGTAFNEHPNPTTHPTIPEGSTQPQIAAITNRHKEEKRLYKEQECIKKALKNQLTQAFDETYIEELKNTYTGYNNVLIQNMLDFLYKTYGQITSIDLETNENKMSKPYNEDLPFSVFIKQIDDGVEFAEAGGVDFTAKQIVSKAYNILLKSGVYLLGCREWEHKPDEDKTWVNFKKHFTKEYRLLKTQRSLGTTESFQRANAIKEVLERQEEFHKCSTDVLQDIANIVQNKPEDTANLVKLADFEELKENYKKMQNDISNIYKILKDEKTNEKQIPNKFKKNKYCWTHGICGHKSENCKNKADGHQDAATANNKIGGNMEIWAKS